MSDSIQFPSRCHPLEFFDSSLNRLMMNHFRNATANCERRREILNPIVACFQRLLCQFLPPGAVGVGLNQLLLRFSTSIGQLNLLPRLCQIVKSFGVQ